MTQNLKDIKLETSYSTEEMDLLKDFYIPALSVAKNYYRITGYFSASSIAAAAKGISELIENEGKIKLVTGFFTNEKDVLIAEELIENPQKIITEMEKIIDQFDNLEDALTKEYVKAFAWLLAKGLMEIKIAVPKKKYLEGYESIFHQKIGLIEDSNGNSISFSGSINETFSAWSLNIENFKVFRNWEKNEKEYYESDRHTFFSIWNNLSDKVMVFNLDEALKKKLIKLAPKTKDEIDLNLLRGKSLPKNRTSKLPPLRKYQEEAVKSWDINNKGILEMATGTGKTIVGLKIISDFINRDSSLVLVVAPTIEICKQWRDEIANNLITDYIITVSSRNNSWKKETKNCLHRLSRSRIKSSVFISTYESLENLWGIMKGVELKNVLLIADEVHSFGATKRSKLLEDDVFSEKINNRLGLSATPERMYDDDGNKAIDSFFGGTIFKYTIGDAIRDKILCPYYFYPHIVNMSETEYREYLIHLRRSI